MSGDEETTGVQYPTGSKVWTRLEPLTRNGDMEAGLRAPVHDPLWLLGRQWQVGEFHGEDAGSPIDARVEVTHDAVTGVQLAEGESFAYDPMTDGPLEAVVERENLTTAGDRPGARQRAEAGQYFIRLLEIERDDDGAETVTAADLPADLRLEPPEESLDPADERYVSLMAGRALDGHAIAEAVEGGSTPSIDGVSASAVDRAAAAYAEWYRDLYDEPTGETGDAWDAERFEYRFTVATGEGDAQRTFEAEEYPGGRLDWYAFAASNDALDVEGPSDGARTETNINRLPTPIDFPGMPAPRWWEFEDSSLNLERLAAPPESPAQLAMLEFVLVYGNDWFQLPVETPVGSLSRVTSLEITDTFGVKTTERDGEPVTVPPVDDDDWNIFMLDLPWADDGPSRGLFVPPVLGDVAESDPVERVVLARDEMANLAFGIEELRESAVGTPVDSEAFRDPGLAIGNVRPADEPSREVVVLENTGTVELDAAGWTLEVVAGDGSALIGPVDLDGLVIQPGASVTIVMGAAPASGEEESTGVARGDRYLGAGDPVLGHDDAEHVVVREPGDPSGRVADRARVPDPGGSLLPAYRLATAVPDHWFPLKPTGPAADREYRYRLARLLDIDALDDDVADLPEPEGRILDDSVGSADEPVYVYEEEVTRAGVELTRSYQLARWLGGSTHLWSGRRARTGRGEGSSGLRFDLLDE